MEQAKCANWRTCGSATPKYVIKKWIIGYGRYGGEYKLCETCALNFEKLKNEKYSEEVPVTVFLSKEPYRSRE